MILFKPEHVELILSGMKTQTRRKSKRRRWIEGAKHKCYTKPPWSEGGADEFATVRITAVRQEQLGQISASDARAEGYAGIADYLDAYRRILCVPDEKLIDELGTEV